MQLTQGPERNSYGTRIPGFWLYKTTSTFLFKVDIYNQALSYKQFAVTDIPYESNREYSIHIQTEAVILNGSSIHKVWISIDDEIVGVGYNYGAKVLNNVKVYCEGPWYDAINATVLDLDYGPLT